MSFDLPKGWTSQSIENAMEAIIDYRGKTPKKSDSGIPLITAKIVKSGRLETPTEFIPEEDYDAWMVRGLPQAGDVVLTTEAPLGEVAQLDDANVALAQRIVTLRGKPDLLVNDYLKYLLQSHAVQQQLDARGSGSTVKGIKQSELRKVVLSLPPIVQQRSIAGILKSLDDKITLNTQTNQTLEQMAQALFKSWFVDFDPVIDNALDSGFFEREFAGEGIPEPLAKRVAIRQALREAAGADTDASAIGRLPPETRALFPDRFEKHPDLGWIPEGWEVLTADSVADVTIGKTPPRKESQWFSDTPSQNVTWVSIKDMGNAGPFVLDSSEYLVPDAVDKFNIKTVPAGSVLLSFKLTLGRVCMVKSTLTTNEAIAHFSNYRKGLNRDFIYCYLKQFNYEMLGSTSSIATAVNSKIIKAMSVLVPSGRASQMFSELVAPWFDMVLSRSEENRELTNLRDTLLPKLLSGELTLAEEGPERDLVDEDLAPTKTKKVQV
ncbi:restriction endonuclease subunit S [Shewanella algae]|uniref:restriction endonuclease subunit S n=1 Tax=Shewanella algae TaxID=38313 RepID=UPI0031F51A6A